MNFETIAQRIYRRSEAFLFYNILNSITRHPSNSLFRNYFRGKRLISISNHFIAVLAIAQYIEFDAILKINKEYRVSIATGGSQANKFIFR